MVPESESFDKDGELELIEGKWWLSIILLVDGTGSLKLARDTVRALIESRGSEHSIYLFKLHTPVRTH